MSEKGIRKQFQKMKHTKNSLQTNNEQESIKNKQWFINQENNKKSQKILESKMKKLHEKKIAKTTK